MQALYCETEPHPKSELLGDFSNRVDIKFVFVSIRLCLVLLSHVFQVLPPLALCQKVWLEKTVISHGNINPEEAFNTFHKIKPLSLSSLERTRNWKKWSLDSHPECDVNELLCFLAWCCSEWTSGKNLSLIPVQEREFPNLGHTGMKVTPYPFLPMVLPGVAEMPGSLLVPMDKSFTFLCLIVRGFLNGKRLTSVLSGQTSLAEQEIPRGSGGILKGWRGVLQNASLATTETEVCYL